MELVNPVSRSTADSYSADFCVKNHLVDDISRKNTFEQTLSDIRIKLLKKKQPKKMYIGINLW